MRPLLAALCLLLGHLAYAEAGHECGHIPPERVSWLNSVYDSMGAIEATPLLKDFSHV